MKQIAIIFAMLFLVTLGCKDKKSNDLTEAETLENEKLEALINTNDSISNQLEESAQRIEKAVDSLENVLNEIN